MHLEKLQNLFLSELKDLFNAEKQIVQALPTFIQAAENKELKEGLEKHLQETRQHVERLNQIFQILKQQPSEETCEAMEGLIREALGVLQDNERSALRDAAMISKLQRIEHYEISVYGTLRTFAKELDLSKAVKLLQDSLDEEGNADKTLTKLAEGGFIFSGINRKANQ